MAVPTTNRYQAALAFLYDRIDYERTSVPSQLEGLKLGRMRRLLQLLGDPQDRCPIVHVAGTKGKGSTAALIAAILTESGRKTGLYTSPHLEHVEERIAIDGRPVTSGEFADLVEAIRPAVERLEREAAAGSRPDDDEGGPTFFEITTAMAMLHFARCGAEAAVLEVGLGGRLDSTNVCSPAVCVITSISYDHTKQLGATLAAIAGEKAGIFKPNVPAIVGVRAAEPLDVIRRVAAEKQVRLWEIGRDFDYVYQSPRAVAPTAGRTTARLHYVEPGWAPANKEATNGEPASGGELFSGCLHDAPLRMLGEHQAANASVALATIGRLVEQGWKIPEAAVRRALASASCPGRVELLGERPTVILDTAHNVASIAALVAALDELDDQGERHLVFGVSRDKDVAGMLRALVGHFDRMIFTKYQHNPRGMPAAELRALAEQALAEFTAERAFPAASSAARNARLPRLESCDSPLEAWERTRASAGSDDTICVTGSFYLAAELRPRLRGE